MYILSEKRLRNAIKPPEAFFSEKSSTFVGTTMTSHLLVNARSTDLCFTHAFIQWQVVLSKTIIPMYYVSYNIYILYKFIRDMTTNFSITMVLVQCFI